MSSFPKQVWDGKSPSRSDLAAEFPPTYQDWMTLVREVQAMQEYLLAVTGNIQAMPNLDAALADCSAKLAKVDELIEQRTPPEDLKRELISQAKLIAESDCRPTCTQLASEIAAIRSEHLEQGLCHKKDSLERNQNDNRFKSDHRRDYDAFKVEVRGVLDQIKAQVAKIEGLVSLQQSIAKLQKLES